MTIPILLLKSLVMVGGISVEVPWVDLRSFVTKLLSHHVIVSLHVEVRALREVMYYKLRPSVWVVLKQLWPPTGQWPRREETRGAHLLSL